MTTRDKPGDDRTLGSAAPADPDRAGPAVLAAQSQDSPQARDQAWRCLHRRHPLRYQGGQVRSLLSLLSYFGSGEYRERFLGVKIPPTNIQDYHLEAARKFADGLASRLVVAGELQ